MLFCVIIVASSQLNELNFWVEMIIIFLEFHRNMTVIKSCATSCLLMSFMLSPFCDRCVNDQLVSAYVVLNLILLDIGVRLELINFHVLY